MSEKYNVYKYGKEKEKNTIKHKYSPEEYRLKRTELQSHLETIQNTLEKCLKSSLKVRMVEINLNNIAQAIEYYYNPETTRELAKINKTYFESAKQIVKLTRFLHEDKSSDQIQKNILVQLENVISQLQKQREYIADIEAQRYDMSKLQANNLA